MDVMLVILGVLIAFATHRDIISYLQRKNNSIDRIIS